MKERLVNAIADMQEEEALSLAREMLEAGEDPRDVLDAGRQAMAIIGERYETKEYYLPELIIGGEVLKQMAEMAKPKLMGQATDGQKLGTVLLGTVAGDIHDIGKDVVGFMLEVNNFEVHDLGVDVPVEQFVAKIKEIQPDVLGMSGFLTLAFDQMRVTVDGIKEAGLRDRVRIMIGGAPMDDSAAQYIGADAYGRDATAAVKLAKDWVGGK